ncbi:hypothetical protein BJV78DRAFT_201192 [Lactifluus subvellereus]|nr:hypothetical protein BJV78DRAFT_201192 [Lactifluus subvellereus]
MGKRALTPASLAYSVDATLPTQFHNWLLRPATTAMAKRATTAHFHALFSNLPINYIASLETRPTAHLCTSGPHLASPLPAQQYPRSTSMRGGRRICSMCLCASAAYTVESHSRAFSSPLRAYSGEPSGVEEAEFAFAGSSRELVVVYLFRFRVALQLLNLQRTWQWPGFWRESVVFRVFVVRTTPDLRTKSHTFRCFPRLLVFMFTTSHTRQPAQSTSLQPCDCTPPTPPCYYSQASPLTAPCSMHCQVLFLWFTLSLFFPYCLLSCMNPYAPCNHHHSPCIHPSRAYCVTSESLLCNS